jgi:STE24 endopeptidase
VGKVPVRVQSVHRLTALPNAEAVGLGPTRRVILTDTLLSGRFTDRQVRVVLAHELGHQQRGHIWKSLVWSFLLLLPAAWVVALVTRRCGGMCRPEAVPLALLVVLVLQLVALPVHSAISRHLEAEADWVALDTTRDPQAAATLFHRLAAVSLQQPDPPTWDYLLLEDHPTAAQRIAMARAWAARREP